MKLRLVTLKDCEALLAIYADYIKNSEITFEYEVTSIMEYKERIQSICKDYPYLVMEEQGDVIGYAYAHRMFERRAYDWDVELSVYLKKGWASKGYGSYLFAALLELLKLQQVRNAYSLITLPNQASEGLQKKHGFTQCGVYHKTGYKHGKWLDVGVYEKKLLEYDEQPADLILFHELNSEQVNRILNIERGKR